MQLKIRRSQREGGILSKSVIFCLDARAQFTQAEQDSIARYKLSNEIVYSSQAAERYASRGDAQQDGSVGGNFKAIASFAMARLQLNVSIGSLARGQHIECKSLEELLDAEDAIMTACRNLKGYLDAAATFDGRDVLFDFSDGGPVAVAHSAAPEPALLTATPAVAIPPPAPAALMSPAPAAEPAAPPPEAVTYHESYTGGAGYQAGRTFRSYFDPGPEGERQMKTAIIVASVLGFLLLIAVAS